MKITRIFKKLTAILLSVVISISSAQFTFAATHFYIDWNVNNLRYTQQYRWNGWALNKTAYTDAEWANFIWRFFEYSYLGVGGSITDYSQFYELYSTAFNKDAPAYDGDPFHSGILFTQYDEEFLINDEMLYGETDLWDQFSALDKQNKTPIHSFNVSQSTNDAFFNHMDVPYAADNPVILEVEEMGVAYHVDGKPYGDFLDRTAYDMAPPRDWGWYYYLYVPGVTEADHNPQSNISTDYRRAKNIFPEKKTYPDGTLRYTEFDPIEVVSGDFVWQYSDLAIRGKHDLAFTRMYDNLSTAIGALGKGWSTNFDYTLEVDHARAYFTLPNGEGVPFAFDSETGAFAPSSEWQTGYTLSYIDSLNRTTRGLTMPESVESGPADGYMLRAEFHINNPENLEDLEDLEDLENLENLEQPEITSDSDLSTSPSALDVVEDNIEPLRLRSARMSNNDGVSLAADRTNEEPFSDSNEMIPVDEPVEHSFTTDDGTEIVMSVEKVPYGNSQQPIMRSARVNSASAAPSSLFNPVDKSFIVEYKDGTKYFFNTDQKITSIEQNGVTKYTYLYNGAGQVRRVEGRYGAGFNLSYNDGGKLQSVTDSAGAMVTFGYAGDLLVESVNPDGDNLTYSYDSLQNLTAIKDFAGAVYITNIFDMNNRVIKQTVADRGICTAIYDDLNRVNTFTDPEGNWAKYTYDDTFAVTRIETEDGTIRSLNTPEGKIQEQTDRMGNKTIFQYDNLGRQNVVVHPDGTKEEIVYNRNNMPIGVKAINSYGSIVKSVTMAYDDENNLLSFIDGNGNTASYTYDNGNIISFTDRMGNTTHYSYDSNGFLAASTDPTGVVTQYSYDSSGKLLSVTTPLNETTSSNYSSAGKLQSSTNPKNKSQYLTSDKNGLPTGLSDYLGNMQTTVYDAQGSPIEKTDYEGNKTFYTYDNIGNLINQTDALGYTIGYQYDSMNRLSAQTDANGNITRFTYDENGNRLSETNADGRGVSYTYDNMGRISTQASSQSGAVYFEYDGLGRIIKQTDSMGGVISNVYDANGNITEQTVNGGVTSNTYDREDRLIKSVNPAVDLTEFTYDSMGRVISIKAVNGSVLTTVYDANGQKTKETDGQNRITEFMYDSTGLLVERKNPDSTSILYEYDANGRLITQTEPDGGKITYEYNKNGQIIKTTDALNNSITNTYNSRGELVSVADSQGHTRKYSYDGNGNLIAEIDTMNAMTTRTYNESNQVESVTNPDGGTTRYHYNERGLLEKETNTLGGETVYMYDALGRLVSITNPNDNTSSNEYDQNGNVSKQTDSRGNSTQNSYDAANRLVKTIQPGGGAITYTYKNGEMVAIQYPDGSSQLYEYDFSGNVAKETDQRGNATLYTYDEMNRIIKKTDREGAATEYQYDAAGRNTSVIYPDGGIQKYEYDLNGNLIKEITAGGNETSYVYDSVGNQISVTDALGHTIYNEYDAEGRAVTLTDALGNTRHLEYDSMGRITSITDCEGNKIIYDFDFAGNVTTITDALDYKQMFTYDHSGNLISSIDANGNKTSYEYGGNDLLMKEIDTLGYSISYRYDIMDRMSEIVNPRGAVSKNIYDQQGRIIKHIDALGYTEEYNYDANGNITSMTDATGAVTSYEYDKENRLIKSTDALGNTETYDYDFMGRLVRVTNPLGHIEETAYDLDGNTLSAKDKFSSATIYEYDLLGMLIAKTEADGSTIQYSYDNAGNLLKQVNQDGGVHTYSYNKNNQLIKEIDPEGGIYVYMYGAAGQVSKQTDPEDGVTQYFYDGNGNMVKQINPDGGIVERVYDGMNRLVLVVDPERNTTAYTYDEVGNLTSVTDPLGNIKRYTFDLLDRNTEVINPLGGQYTIEYDAAGRVIRTTDEEGAVTEYNYDPLGRIAEAKDALGHSIVNTYDAIGNLLSRTNERGAVEKYTYTLNGLVETYIDPLGNVTKYTYDSLGRMIGETDPLGNLVSYEYNAVGQVVSKADSIGAVERFTYDLLNRIKTVADGKGNITAYEYDKNGNIVKTTDALGNTSLFEYDSMNRLTKMSTGEVSDSARVTLYEYSKNGLVTKEINALGDGKIYTYDANGNLLSQTDEDGYITEYAYNALDLVSEINYNGAKTALYAYNKTGRLIKVSDWIGVTEFELDSLNHIKEVKDANNHITSYKYDENGNKTGIVYPDGNMVEYVYDLSNRMTLAIDAESKETKYTYDKAGRLISTEYPNGEKSVNEYDARDQLIQTAETINGELRKSYKYTYDAAGNLTKEQDQGIGYAKGSQTKVYAYDANNRLTSANDSQGRRSYKYDVYGNISEEVSNGKVASLSYNALNQLLTKSGDGGGKFTYDKRGNLIEETSDIGTSTYTYDETNRMVKGVNSKGEASIYTFNGLGYRVWLEQDIPNVNISLYTNNHNTGGNRYIGLLEEEANAGIVIPDGQETYENNYGLTRQLDNIKRTKFVVDYTSQYARDLMEFTDGRYVTRNMFGLDQLSQTVYNTDKIEITENAANTIAAEAIQKVYIHHDRMGSTVYATSQTGNVVAHTDYDEWGKTVEYKQLDMNFSGLDSMVNYTGHDYDAVLQKYFSQTRMYNAIAKVFTAKDQASYASIAQPITLNLYAYALQNPLTYVDPSGHAGEPVAASNRSRGYYTQWLPGYITGGSTNAISKYSDFRNRIITLYEGMHYQIRSDTAYYINGLGPIPEGLKVRNAYESLGYSVGRSGNFADIIISKDGYQPKRLSFGKEYYLGSNGTAYFETGYTATNLSALPYVATSTQTPKLSVGEYTQNPSESGNSANNSSNGSSNYSISTKTDEKVIASLRTETFSREEFLKFDDLSGKKGQDSNDYKSTDEYKLYHQYDVNSPYGGDQGWYEQIMNRKYMNDAGCGSIAAANILTYYAQNFSIAEDLVPDKIPTVQQFTSFAFDLYYKHTPQTIPNIGIWFIEELSTGITVYAKDKGIELEPHILHNKANSYFAAADFIKNGLDQNYPVILFTHFNDYAESFHSANIAAQFHYVTITVLNEIATSKYLISNSVAQNFNGSSKFLISRLVDYSLIISTWGLRTKIPSLQKFWEDESIGARLTAKIGYANVSLAYYSIN